MTASRLQGKPLTEEDICVAARQYDAGLVYHLSLPRHGLCQIEPNALARCQWLQLLDLSGNKLTTLAGIEPVAALLTFLNVAENTLTDISALAGFSALQYCHLEGNELASVASLQVLVSLPQLVELVLQRTAPLFGADPQEALLLDNPVCRNAEAYQREFLLQVHHVRWVDGVPAFRRQREAAAASGKRDADEGERKEMSNEALLRAASAAHERTMEELARDNNEEGTLLKLLADAAKKCATAVHA